MVELLKHLKINLCGNIIRCELRVIIGIDIKTFGMAPLYITELLSYRTCSRTLRSTDQKLLAVPKSRLKTYGDRAFSVAAPKLWNELPLDLRSLVTINLFKKHLKTDLFKKAYNGIYCDIFINKTANTFLIYSYFITSGIFLNYFNIMICKALWSISGVSAI